MNVQPPKIQQLFYGSQVIFGLLFLVVAWIFFRPKAPESGFRVRESDLEDERKKKIGTAQLAKQKTQHQKEQLRLGGIRLDAPAHEILGVQSSASESEIQSAYRELMKRFHPDKVGRPGSREWQDAQKIAQAIVRAKTELLALRKRS